ncbi:hypothetical protein [Derxia gummosa]|uniref:Uncharacterized protein n=1 Tax=Derxia gummosa DSM 723 TaxID=1121388 RepID=A0A8B6X527_9BURK|nr:hypothetical protein [Derxia gummosa]
MKPTRRAGMRPAADRSAPADAPARDADPAAPRGAFTAPPKRNPLVAAALLRKAGAHRKSHKALRRGRRSRGEDGTPDE